MNKIIFVGHEASATGAPFTQLYLIRWLKQYTDYKIALVLLAGGVLESEFRSTVDEIYIVASPPAITIVQRAKAKLDRITKYRYRLMMRQLKRYKSSLIFANTALTIDFAAQIKIATSSKLIINIHELESAFSGYAPERFLRSIPTVDKFIMGSRAVKRFYQEWCNIDETKIEVVYDFIDNELSGTSNADNLRLKFGIPLTSKVIGAIAVLYPRKGADIFVQVAKEVLISEPTTYFIWVGGNKNSPEYKAIQRDLRLLGINNKVLFVGEQHDLRGYYDLFDVFLMPSREDPFPLVCLEAALAGNPIICFNNAGGMPEFVRDDAGVVVPYMSVNGMAEAAISLLRNEKLRNISGQIGRRRVIEEHTIAAIGPAMFAVMQRLLLDS